MASISRIGSVSTKPMAYSVNNKASVSSAYNESMEVTKAGAVDAASPVGYANAQNTSVEGVSRVDATEALAKTQQVSKEYNDIASNFKGNTSYDANKVASSYSTVGTNFDVYA